MEQSNYFIKNLVFIGETFFRFPHAPDKWNIVALSKMLGVHNTTVRTWLAGELPRQVTLKKVVPKVTALFQRQLDYSVQYTTNDLFAVDFSEKYKDQKFQPYKETDADAIGVLAKTKEAKTLRSIPLVKEVPDRTNGLRLSIQSLTIGEVLTDRGSEEAMFALVANKNGMDPMISSSDRLIIDPQSEISDGHIVVAKIEDHQDVLAKIRYYDNNMVCFCFANQDFRPSIMEANKIISMYRVVEVIKKL